MAESLGDMLSLWYLFFSTLFGWNDWKWGRNRDVRGTLLLISLSPYLYGVKQGECEPESVKVRQRADPRGPLVDTN
jgi:hypothetical protein